MEILLGKEHFLNMPNCILGIVFYSMQFVLGKCSLSKYLLYKIAIIIKCTDDE